MFLYTGAHAALLVTHQRRKYGIRTLGAIGLLVSRSASMTPVPDLNLDAGHIAPPSNVIAAFYDGFLRNDITPIEPACPSGNCTWPLTPSLGVCGGCVDSKYTKRSCFNPDPCPKNGTKKGSTDDEFCDKARHMDIATTHYHPA